MTARCGSNDPAHRSKTCRACDRLYKLRHKNGAPLFSMRIRVNGATCVLCGLTAGNSADIPVYRYPLKRHFRGKGQKWIGNIGLCDECVMRFGELKEPYRSAA